MKTIIISIISLFYCYAVNAQQAPTVFIYENNVRLSKDSIIKMGQLNINDTSYIIDSFVYVITGQRIKGEQYPIFGLNKGNKFCNHFVDELLNYQSNSGSIMIQDIWVHNSKKDFGYTRKLAQYPVFIF